MLAIIQCDQEFEATLWKHRDFVDRSLEYVLAKPKRLWKGRKVGLLAIESKGVKKIEFMCECISGAGVGDFDRRVIVRRITPIAPVSLHEIVKLLGRGFDSLVQHDGQLGKKESMAFIEVLLELHPKLRATYEELSRSDDPLVLDTPRRELLAWERDAVGVVFDMAGFDRGVLAEWRVDRSVRPVPFLEGIPQRPRSEERLVEHDAARFLDWSASGSTREAWRVFESNEQTLFVTNVGGEGLENGLGMDLIYYHENRDSFVFVQYKKMKRSDGDWCYYPDSDSNVDDELARMRRVDESCDEVKEGGFRLSVAPSYIKLCQARGEMAQGAELIQGMYLARSQFEELRSSDAILGPRGGVRFGYRTVPQYLSNTMFCDLVRGGFIGSRGKGSEFLRRCVQEILEYGHSVTLGVLVGDNLRQAQRTSRRKSRRAGPVL
ncbi:hypothetical protein [Actinomadura sp. NTSP31]|uniref:hypothetical protein n=1 Tax=Actinomadura sp. NTSP31 TaxID=1735447 RepID=UPI0035C04465